MTTIPTNLCDLFANAVTRFPDNLAVDHKEGCLTYRELDDVSSNLAKHLVDLGVGHGSPVLLITRHGSFNLIAIIAILKSGGCFVPIDRETWSPDMIQYVCNTVQGPVIINTTPEPFISSDEHRYVVHLTELPKTGVETNLDGLAHSIGSADTACLIFTSGSTGRPKGVIISHLSLSFYSKTSPVNLDIAPGDRLLHMLSVAFDASACMLFSALGNGGTVVPVQAEDVFQEASTCTVMAATPSLLKNLPTPNSEYSICSRVHTIILGGETASPELLGAWLDSGVRVLTAYGVTETTSMGSIHQAQRDPRTSKIDPFLIGGPLAQSPIWLVDSDMATIEDESVDGEIIIGGAGVAEGYYMDAEATNRKFIEWNGTRAYKTGDYGRWVRGPAGDLVIEFRGRRDRTVKNRGFLVNLDRDVEESLLNVGKSFGVVSVCVAAADNGIIAVVTPSSVDTSALLDKAKQSMCSYYIPCRIEAVEAFPLSSNGKVQPKKIFDMIVAIDEGRDPHIDAAVTLSSTGIEVPTIPTTVPKDKFETLLQAAEEVLRAPGTKLRKLRGEDSFLKMGGSSLLALKLVSVLRQQNLHISMRDLTQCQTFLEISKIATMITLGPEHPASLGTRDPAVAQSLAELRAQVSTTLGLANPAFDVGPLTGLQLEFALPTLADESKCVNQIKLTYDGIHADMMDRAWRVVWQAEPVFRTELSLLVGCGAQIIHKKPFRQPSHRRLASRSAYDQAVKNASISVGLGCTLEFLAYVHPSDTAAEDIMPRDVAELTVIFTIHHSLMDGVSLKLLLDSVERVAHGRSLPCSPSTSSLDANIGLRTLQRDRDREARDFFTDYLKDIPLINSKEAKRLRTSAPKNEEGEAGLTKTVFLETSASMADIKAFASRNCVSAACVYYTAWAMAISAAEKSSVVVVGGVFSNRGAQPGHEATMGPYMSTLPLVFRFDGAERVAARLRRTMDDLSNLSDYAWARSDQVGIGRRLRNLLAMQLPLPDEHSKPPTLRTESIETTDFPLSMLVEADGNLRVVYDPAQFDIKTVRRIGEHFKHSLQSLLKETRIEDCMRLNRFQETVIEEAQQAESQGYMETVKIALEQSVDRFFQHTALEDCTGTAITYGELERLSNIIAHGLNASLPGTENVALYGDGTTGWILGLLGVLKSGRAFVPLDPKWPVDRRAAVCVKSSAGALLLPSTTQRREAPVIQGMRVLAVDELLDRAQTLGKSVRLPDTVPTDSDLAIVFTSGTTGTPKGIPVTNRGFLALQCNLEATMFAAPGRRIAQFMSPAFDYCILEIFSTLLHGATLVLRDPSDPYAHLSRVNAATITPSVLSVLDPEEFPNLEMIYATGEPVTASIVSKFGTQALFYNGYGPAECTVCSSFTRMIPGDVVTIGTALDTARMYVLDENQKPVPSGVRGEIYVAGVQVMHEYINAPEQTNMRVLPDPWHDGERMYRTGDHGRFGKDGRIIYLGRADRQVKIQGFRVELAEVEQVIVSGPATEGIAQCATIASGGRLVAYVLLSETRRATGNLEDRIALLRNRLSENMPPSWVPQLIFPLDEFPRTANGKIDLRALEAMYTSKISASTSTFTSETAQPVADPGHQNVDAKLAQEWREVLQLGPDTQPQGTDDFFKLGGHSVLIMLLANRLSAAFGVKITVRTLLPAATFQRQVDIINKLLEQKSNQVSRVEALGAIQTHADDGHQVNKLGPEQLTELEQQVWLQHQVATIVTAFNIAKILHLSGTVDVARLVSSLNMALASDPVLGCNIVEGPDGPKRVLRTSSPEARQVTQLDLNVETNHRFDLAHDDLIRVHLIHPAKDNTEGHSEAQLIFVASHVIADLGTLQNLLRLTSRAYSGVAPTLHKEPQHLESGKWTHKSSPEDHEFWRSYLHGHTYRHGKPSLLSNSLNPYPRATFQGSSRIQEFRGGLVPRLNALIRKSGITHHQFALATAAFLLRWLSGETDVVLGGPNSNRTSTAEREALGQFLDRLPIRVKLPSPTEEHVKTTAVLTQVRDSALKALANAISFKSVLEALDYPSGELHHPLFECMVTFHPRSAGLDNWLQLPGCEVTASSRFAHGAKFPLMLEWFELAPDCWSLHIEHETNHVPPSAVDMIEDALEVILDAMADECSITELQARLAILDAGDVSSREKSIRSRSTSSSRSSKTSGESISLESMVKTIQTEMTACLQVNSGVLSPETSFFAAGADSTAVISLRQRMRKLGLDVPVRAIFVAQSPVKLAEHVLLDSCWGFLGH